MEILMQNIISGVETGALYALAALGLVLIFRTSDVINFAQGEIAMFSTFVTFRLWQGDMPFFLAVILSLAFAIIFGYAIERIFLRKMVQANIISKIIITLGIVMIVQGVAVVIFGAQDYYMRKFIQMDNLNVAGVVIQPNSLLIIALIAIIVGVFTYLVNQTKFGISIRATAEDETTARLMGIPISKVYSRSWMIATMLGAMAGILVAPKTQVSVTMMVDIHLKSFIAAVVGGFGSFIGPVIGGLLIGVFDNLVGFYLSLDWKTVIVYGLLILILIIKPKGLLGTIQREKV